jgi:hypothetical protein
MVLINILIESTKMQIQTEIQGRSYVQARFMVLEHSLKCAQKDAAFYTLELRALNGVYDPYGSVEANARQLRRELEKVQREIRFCESEMERLTQPDPVYQVRMSLDGHTLDKVHYEGTKDDCDWWVAKQQESKHRLTGMYRWRIEQV